MKKKLLATALTTLMAVTPVFAETLKMSHVRPQDATIDVELRSFAASVAEATDGAVEIQLFPASALGDYTAVQERISVGALDMATQPAAAAADRRMQISSFPYLAETWAQAQKIYGPGGAVREVMNGLYAEQDITVLAAYPVYFGGIALNVENANPASTEPNGIKVRVPGVKAFQLEGEALGYIPSPIPFSEAFTAVQTGVVDGVIGSGAEGYYASFRDVTKTYIPANTHFEVWYMIISNESLAALSDEDQAVLKEQAAAFEATRWTVAEADQTRNEQRLVDDLGTTVAKLTAEDLAAMSAKVRAEVWPVVLEDVGTEWGQKILDQVAAAAE
ncbi:TRAP transporter substrate-binding protein DctP [Pseudosulfitobacter pseudonitzschiae]|nr:TRAP transporter substrate-binding protein DctP [Pseudosulfitobacter pseudonitzschiae]MBM1817968.1 TRAP transporter substrate-binding protein DctP [Pseudosulfitobacter pseudonitzschiae]MBM1835026.1 TRAP transporter substrate-binding protein DctP [Pseudosulfitobacter pseudonitzschiae]MBM1839827.1 TRAP transporter substrate-binding protein DctP [Pseudosulfitobacter pseudonitzschiae]MBM1844757.1 TRAP transporter substrate-binding protein DctP [Pseudosulfitobacter pseudonitzschiae]MBM1849560.1 